MPSAPTFTAVPMFRAPTGRVRISAQPQLDQARDRDASGQTDRHPGGQAPDQQPGQSLPRREQPLRHFHSAIDHDLYAEVTLIADGGQTTVVWEERGLPVAYLAGYGAGIQVHVEDLGAYLAGRERCDAGARMGELSPAYEPLAAKVS